MTSNIRQRQSLQRAFFSLFRWTTSKSSYSSLSTPIFFVSRTLSPVCSFPISSLLFSGSPRASWSVMPVSSLKSLQNASSFMFSYCAFSLKWLKKTIIPGYRNRRSWLGSASKTFPFPLSRQSIQFNASTFATPYSSVIFFISSFWPRQRSPQTIMSPPEERCVKLNKALRSRTNYINAHVCNHQMRKRGKFLFPCPNRTLRL